MSLVMFFSVALVLILYFSVTSRTLHLYEGIIIWSFLIFIQNNFIWVVSLNLKLFTMSPTVKDHFVRNSIESIIVPLIVMLFLEGNSKPRKKFIKILYWLSAICFITGVEYVAAYFKVIVHSSRWMMIWSFTFSSSVVLLSFVLFKVIRRSAQKDVMV